MVCLFSCSHFGSSHFHSKLTLQGARSCVDEDPSVAALEAELSRSPRGAGAVEGWCGYRCTCGPSVKRLCRTGEVRGAIPAMLTLFPVELNHVVCVWRNAMPTPGRQQSSPPMVSSRHSVKQRKRHPHIKEGLGASPESIQNVVACAAEIGPVEQDTSTTTSLERSRHRARAKHRFWNLMENERALQGSATPLEEAVDVGPMNFTQHRREHVMKIVPFFLKGGFSAALRVALEARNVAMSRRKNRMEAVLPLTAHVVEPTVPWRAGPTKKLEARFEKFFSGQRMSLIDDSTDVSSQAALGSSQEETRNGDRQAASREFGHDRRVVSRTAGHGKNTQRSSTTTVGNDL